MFGMGVVLSLAGGRASDYSVSGWGAEMVLPVFLCSRFCHNLPMIGAYVSFIALQ